MKYLASLVAFLSSFVAATSTTACWTVLFDEPKMPESLLK